MIDIRFRKSACLFEWIQITVEDALWAKNGYKSSRITVQQFPVKKANLLFGGLERIIRLFFAKIIASAIDSHRWLQSPEYSISYRYNLK
jgi:hypothetical protein